MQTSNISILLAVCVVTISNSGAQEELSPAEKEFQKIEWLEEGVGKLRSEAEVEIPRNFIFTGRKGTEIYLKLTGNLVGEDEVGIIAPASMDWWVLFEFDKVGYVKDDDEIDSDKLLENM